MLDAALTKKTEVTPRIPTQGYESIQFGSIGSQDKNQLFRSGEEPIPGKRDDPRNILGHVFLGKTR